MTNDVDLEYTHVPEQCARSVNYTLLPGSQLYRLLGEIRDVIEAFFRSPRAKSVTVRVELNKR